jgi:2-polyprenyl-3-methyl-5-hydroxy-6-metoxy-1,4-benzoquinol methylase
MSTADFYDAMAPFYHLIYPDWAASIDRQGEVLAGIIRDNWGSAAHRVLDATCGIGTQSLGLAARGFEVSASDLSPQSVARLRHEASMRGLQINTSVCDVRRLSDHHRRAFDVVISCDNALPHLHTHADLPLALRQMLLCTRTGGGCIISIRDYAVEDLSGQVL